MTDSSSGASSTIPPPLPEDSASVSTSPSEAFEVLRTCLSYRPAAARRDTLRSFVDAGLDWGAIRREAARHRVLPLFYRRLESLLGEALPASVRETGRECRRGVRTRNAFLAQELGRVTEAFETADLPVLTLKGPVLSQVAYGDIASRHSVDMDLVIPKRRFSEADRLLHDMGYEYASARASLDGWQKMLSLYKDGQWEFVRRGSFTLDIHTRIMPPGYAFSADLQPFLKRSQPVSLRGDVTVPGFAPEDRILVLAYHGVKNQWRILRHVTDVAGALQAPSNLDWDLLRRRARNFHAMRTAQLALVLAQDLLGASLPSYVEKWSSEGSVRDVAASMKDYLRERPETSALAYRERVRLQLATKDTFAGQLRYGVHSLLQHFWSALLRP